MCQASEGELCAVWAELAYSSCWKLEGHTSGQQSDRTLRDPCHAVEGHPDQHLGQSLPYPDSCQLLPGLLGSGPFSVLTPLGEEEAIVLPSSLPGPREVLLSQTGWGSCHLFYTCLPQPVPSGQELPAVPRDQQEPPPI